MLLHLVPKFLTSQMSGRNVVLESLEIPELDLCLRGDLNLVSRRPYPNKHYVTACRRKGNKAIHGILIKTDDWHEQLTVKSQWINGNGIRAEHVLNLAVMDRDFSAVTTDLGLLSRTHESLGSWSNRWPEHLGHLTPANGTPKMEMSPSDHKGDVVDRKEGSLIVHRTETLAIPTVEEERLYPGASWVDRMPEPEDAFVVVAANTGYTRIAYRTENGVHRI